MPFCGVGGTRGTRDTGTGTGLGKGKERGDLGKGCCRGTPFTVVRPRARPRHYWTTQQGQQGQGRSLRMGARSADGDTASKPSSLNQMGILG